MREWACGYCFGISNGQMPPVECQHCHIGRCGACWSWIRSGSKWCYGCGVIVPNIAADMTDTSSTAVLYEEEAWIKRNISGCSPGQHHISSGYCLETKTWGHVWLIKPDNTRRELTDEERVALGYKTIEETQRDLAALHKDDK